MNNYFEYIKKFMGAMTKIEKSMQKTIVPTIVNLLKFINEQNKNIEKFADSIRKALSSYQIAEKEAVRILRKYKWFITPDMPISILNKIIKIDSESGNKYSRVNELFKSYFFGNNFYELKKLIDKWNTIPLFKKRMKILKDCIYFITENKNRKINTVNIVLPALIVQIDGIINDYLVQKTGQPAESFSSIKTALRSNRPKVLTSQLDELINIIILDIFLQTSYKYTPLQNPYGFNRHKIIHGENTKYGRIDYLIKSFLILNLLSELSLKI